MTSVWLTQVLYFGMSSAPVQDSRRQRPLPKRGKSSLEPPQTSQGGCFHFAGGPKADRFDRFEWPMKSSLVACEAALPFTPLEWFCKMPIRDSPLFVMPHEDGFSKLSSMGLPPLAKLKLPHETHDLFCIKPNMSFPLLQGPVPRVTLPQGCFRKVRVHGHGSPRRG